jgi:hypothetical protein
MSASYQTRRKEPSNERATEPARVTLDGTAPFARLLTTPPTTLLDLHAVKKEFPHLPRQ